MKNDDSFLMDEIKILSSVYTWVLEFIENIFCIVISSMVYLIFFEIEKEKYQV